MYVIKELSKTELMDYATVAPTRLRDRITGWNVDKCVAFGAAVFQHPAGIVVAGPKRGSATAAEIIALRVAPSQRRIGVGTALVEKTEAALRSRGFESIEMNYFADLPATRPYDAFLASRGWSAANRCAMFCRTDYHHLSQAPWMALDLPAHFEVFHWSTANSRDEKQVRYRLERNLCPAALDPFHRKGARPMPAGSLGLRYRGELVGWCVAYYVAENTVGCHSLYVDPEFQLRGRALALLVRAIKVTPDCDYVFDVDFARDRMRQFVERRMMPYLTSIHDVARRTKPLIPSIPHISNAAEENMTCLSL